MRTERGQGTVEWVGLLLLVALLVAALVAAGVRVPGVGAGARRSHRECSARWPSLTIVGDEPALIAAYGTEVGELVRRHMPSLMFERGSKAVPVDFRRCREHGLRGRVGSKATCADRGGAAGLPLSST